MTTFLIDPTGRPAAPGSITRRCASWYKTTPTKPAGESSSCGVLEHEPPDYPGGFFLAASGGRVNSYAMNT